MDTTQFPKQNCQLIPLKAQVLWQCRRGMLELDMILLPFCEQQYELLSEAQKKDFVQLLSYPDQTLFDWFLGKSVPQMPEEKNLLPIIQFIQQTRQNILLVNKY